jgi:SAM-dependent methyltransferase
MRPFVGRPDDPSDQPSIAVGARATHDAIARDYDAELGDELDRKPLDRGLLGAFVELINEGLVADVGCGPGHVTRFLAARHPDVMGVDLSPGSPVPEIGVDNRFHLS